MGPAPYLKGKTMNLYNELFPEDSVVDYDEKIASESMNYFGIRFDDRVEKLAGFKDVASKGWAALQKAKGKARDLPGIKQFVDYHQGIGGNVRAAATGRPYTGRASIPGKADSILADLGAGGRILEAGKGLAKVLPHAGALGGAGYLYNKKKK